MSNSESTEVRAAAELRANSPNSLVGYAAVFGSDSQDLGGFTESVEPGAFSDTLKSPEGITALYDHDSRSLLGRVGAGTLRLYEDDVGLRFEIDVPPTQLGKDLQVLVSRGDIAGASFAFRTPPGGDSWISRGGVPHRSLHKIDLKEITITANPAYLDTTVALRSLGNSRKMQTRKRLAELFLETVQ